MNLLKFKQLDASLVISWGMETAIIVSIFNIFPLIYTDDMFLLAESPSALQSMLDILF